MYGPQADKTTTVNVTLTIPQGTGPFPVMIGGAASSLIRRGYIACSYSGIGGCARHGRPALSRVTTLPRWDRSPSRSRPSSITC